MNTSSFAMPSEGMMIFYTYYSYFTLFISWLIAPLVFYTILTKSKELSNFKLLILNNSFWCLIFQTFTAFLRPLILSPKMAGFPLGLLRNGNPQITLISHMIAILLIFVCVASLIATLLCRYMLVFPSGFIMRHFSKKIFICVAIIGLLITCLLVGVVWVQIISIDDKTLHQWALDYDPSLAQILIDEPAFVLIPPSFYETSMLIGIINDFGIFIIAIIFSIYFMYLVITLKIQTANASLKRSLLLSGAVQVLLVFILLHLPLFLLIILIRFKIQNTANAVCISFCAALSHCWLESISTLFLVSPYRKFLYSLFSKAFPCLKRKADIVNIRIVSTTNTTIPSTFDKL